MRMSLVAPNMVYGSNAEQGIFTMIYDEGFEVQLGDRVYFAFSRFDLLPDGRNVSRCGETMVGWYRDKRGSHWGCYKGKKVNHAASALVSDATTVLPSTALEKSLSFDAPLSEAWHQSVVDRLNSDDVTLLQTGSTRKQRRTWTAKVYKRYINRTAREINRMAGIKRSFTVAEASAQHAKNRTTTSAPPSFLQQRTRLPNSVDWGEQGMLDKVINQGDCGSCYTVATVRMLSSRRRIANNNKDLGAFSVNFPLYCSEYNQGCDGGYAFLQSKWSEDVGLISEECAGPYASSGTCSGMMANCLQQDHASATRHRYVGGYYGGCDEDAIARELVENGPLVVSFEPKDDFMYYSDGIYKSGPESVHQEWERVDHAVLLVGYGEEAGQKYWRVQNSWGPGWGEGGFFRIARGENDSGVESIAVAADIATGGNDPALVMPIVTTE
eukprot:GEMP01030119.1.p1 GENE.GEMP01030119.1~~GEMP01030119.1.p1  ORF type:complete len:440 (+),score=127.24 GEMP01030119.1:371-1690(+)